MSQAALRLLDHAQAELFAALDGRNVATLETATTGLAEAVEELRSQSGWRGRTHLRRQVIEALGQAEAARGRLNALADRNRRKLDRLMNLAGNPRAQAYRRDGRLD